MNVFTSLSEIITDATGIRGHVPYREQKHLSMALTSLDNFGLLTLGIQTGEGEFTCGMAM